MSAMDALALLELSSVARGYRTLDALLKESPVTIVEANLIEPGRFLILYGGGVAEVDAAQRVGREVAGDSLVDEILLPGADPRLWPAIAGVFDTGEFDTIGVVEGSSVAAVLEACDRAIKNASVALTGLRIERALGGKAFFVVDGEQFDVEAAVEVAAGVLTGRGRLVRSEIIARPHPDFLVHVLRPAPFGAR